jgi:hypothetical protein
MLYGIEENVCRVLAEYRRLESHYALVVTLSNYDSFFKGEEDALKEAWTSLPDYSPVRSQIRRGELGLKSIRNSHSIIILVILSRNRKS